jgi:hypothetical protein
VGVYLLDTFRTDESIESSRRAESCYRNYRLPLAVVKAVNSVKVVHDDFDERRIHKKRLQTPSSVASRKQAAVVTPVEFDQVRIKSDRDEKRKGGRKGIALKVMNTHAHSRSTGLVVAADKTA